MANDVVSRLILIYAVTEIYNLHVFKNLACEPFELAMDGILVHIVISIFYIFKFHYECMRYTALFYVVRAWM
jgi:hypothetical protein